MNKNDRINTIIQGDALEVLKTLPDEYIHCVITSPPYWGLRDYGVDGQIGLEKTPTEYLEKLWAVFDEIKRVLKKDGTCWVNMGDGYGTGSGPGSRAECKQGTNRGTNYYEETGRKGVGGYNKCLLMIPERFAFGMIERGWTLRNKIIWHKTNPMPEPCRDRLSSTWEYLYFFVRSKKYFFDLDAVRIPLAESTPDGIGKFGKGIRKGSEPKIINKNRPSGVRGYKNKPNIEKQPSFHGKDINYSENGKNPGDHLDIATEPCREPHFATYPQKLCHIPIKTGCPEGGIVLDPFAGTNTTGLVADKLGRKWIAIELSEEYIKIAKKRTAQEMLI